MSGPSLRPKFNEEGVDKVCTGERSKRAPMIRSASVRLVDKKYPSSNVDSF
ncbi:hypothetical protein L917_17915 [Phytophthora nicotianae]|uniref:Uncharacterized protein n=1 Tax=Phytophthora nicotianae TaxID=4792 RepID=W2KB95_PHYNI|nr:hypothetical protein L917_17915 [Phytophthora nicotianae]